MAFLYTPVTIRNESFVENCNIAILLLSINYLIAVDTGLPWPNTIPLQSAVVPTGLSILLTSTTVAWSDLHWCCLASLTSQTTLFDSECYCKYFSKLSCCCRAKGCLLTAFIPFRPLNLKLCELNRLYSTLPHNTLCAIEASTRQSSFQHFTALA